MSVRGASPRAVFAAGHAGILTAWPDYPHCAQRRNACLIDVNRRKPREPNLLPWVSGPRQGRVRCIRIQPTEHTMPFRHAVAWLDHSEAHVMHFNDEAAESGKVRARSSHQHQHHKKGAFGSGHAPEDQNYYHEIAGALADAQEILIVGPAGAKLGLLKHLQRHDAEVAGKVVGIESIDHPSDGQLLAYARHYFLKVDNLRGDLPR
jgi:hypothetical protein